MQGGQSDGRARSGRRSLRAEVDDAVTPGTRERLERARDELSFDEQPGVDVWKWNRLVAVRTFGGSALTRHADELDVESLAFHDPD
jgi:hypothetical protein